MATRAATFYPSTTDQDFAATGEVDIRKLVETLGGANQDTAASFGTGTAEIILDPYATRSTTGTTDAPNLGWAINRDGSDGMAVPTPPAGVDSAERFIEAGTWTFRGRLASLATTSNYRMRVRVYKVASDGSRSLLFGPINSNSTAVTGAGADVSASTNPGEVTFDEDETLLVSYGIEKMNSTVGNEQISFRLNDTTGNDCEIVLPAGIRTRYRDTVQVTATGTAANNSLGIALDRAVNGVGTATMSRSVVAAKAVTVNAIGTAAQSKAITPNTITVTGIGTVSGRIQIPIDEIPDDGDFSGSDPNATVAGTVYDSDGNASVGATVLLFRQSDNLFIASTLTDSAGEYSFTRDTADPNEYYVVAFSSDTAHGSSDRSIAPE